MPGTDDEGGEMRRGLKLRLFLLGGLLLGLVSRFISDMGSIGNSRWLQGVFFLLWVGIWALFVRLAIEEALRKRKGRAMAFGFFALLFCPLIPFHPPPFIWLILKVMAIGFVSFSVLAEKEDLSDTRVHEEQDREFLKIPRLLIYGIYLGPVLGFFLLVLVFLPLLFGFDIGRYLALVDFGFLMPFVLLGTGVLSFFLNISVILMFRQHNLPPPLHLIFLPGCYYLVLLSYLHGIFSGPSYDIGDVLFREFFILGGLLVIGVAFAVGVGVVFFSRRTRSPGFPSQDDEKV